MQTIKVALKADSTELKARWDKIESRCINQLVEARSTAGTKWWRKAKGANQPATGAANEVLTAGQNSGGKAKKSTS